MTTSSTSSTHADGDTDTDTGTGTDRGALLEVSLRILRSHPLGFLATTGPDGGPRVRLVQHLAVEDDATVWISASPNSRKVADATARPEVSYAVEDRAAFGYATLYARAELLTTGPELEVHWTESLRPFFPTGPTAGDFALLRLTPHRIEVVDFAARVHPDPYGLAAAVLECGSAGSADSAGKPKV
ncbi:pyridoxamine 5'-phosphate oxidase family protein [Embleya sp. NBC_00896]|uniref:pyridoxamine 5'-phosphate oxidase family protein n=1 Tax=Embleya sp. NBC_00896 TaxID=2975961 RepID=UPI0038681A99|nr:pyridoxamine 5'-phosphate oxidase family protein [Embleya sp. NBC_00896]